jgi:hypothetical protein
MHVVLHACICHMHACTLLCTSARRSVSLHTALQELHSHGNLK